MLRSHRAVYPIGTQELAYPGSAPVPFKLPSWMDGGCGAVATLMWVGTGLCFLPWAQPVPASGLLLWRLLLPETLFPPLPVIFWISARRACTGWAFLRAMGNHEDEEGGMPDSGSRRIPLALLQGMEQQYKAGGLR